MKVIALKAVASVGVVVVLTAAILMGGLREGAGKAEAAPINIYAEVYGGGQIAAVQVDNPFRSYQNNALTFWVIPGRDVLAVECLPNHGTATPMFLPAHGTVGIVINQEPGMSSPVCTALVLP